jgi:hypothetical protein
MRYCRARAIRSIRFRMASQRREPQKFWTSLAWLLSGPLNIVFVYNVYMQLSGENYIAPLWHLFLMFGLTSAVGMAIVIRLFRNEQVTSLRIGIVSIMVAAGVAFSIVVLISLLATGILLFDYLPTDNSTAQMVERRSSGFFAVAVIFYVGMIIGLGYSIVAGLYGALVYRLVAFRLLSRG